jgi:tRNA A37 threonylcarbamoyltransferase TsaD
LYHPIVAMPTRSPLPSVFTSSIGFNNLISIPSAATISLLLKTLSDAATADLCATFQDVAFSHVEDRIKRALDYVDNNNVPVTSLVVVGGVAANKELRR